MSKPTKEDIENKIKLQKLKLKYINTKGEKYKNFNVFKRISEESNEDLKNLNEGVSKLLKDSIKNLEDLL